VELATVFLIAIGLSMDAFAVSIASGFSMDRLRLKSILRISLFFGGFQAIMPVIGFFIGMSVRDYITSFDHWVAFGLLSFVGIRMIHESLSSKDDREKMDAESLPTLVMLAVATSIDALAVGLSLSFLKVDIFFPASIIGITAFVISFFGVIIGKQSGRILGNKVEILGGIILIGIGIKILWDHLVK
jgi:manganese efflux pump family protein